jgi:MerR family transcriptional regulator, redox-sensitive transcriptional activator SoxR
MAVRKRHELSSISAVARRFGLRASAIRYYEQIGLLPAVSRSKGQRVYDERTLERLSIIAVARRAGLSLQDIGQLFCGFQTSTPAPQRWREMSNSKVAELEQLKQEITRTQDLLRKLGQCSCTSLEQCGDKLRERLPAESAKQRVSIQWLGRSASKHVRSKH